ncbi:MAG: transcriptional repressor [Clostridia bacterium]|nr:transcriptional repressor [Clostridia bacterium]
MIKSSHQRDIILHVITDSCDHPNAEMVLERAKDILPSINLATVYRNLDLLSKKRDILRISMGNGDRFDHTVIPHAHFHCLTCNRVFDIDSVNIDNLIEDTQVHHNCVVDGVDIVLNGYCSACTAKKNN